MVSDLAGKTFGDLFVISRHPENTRHGSSRWICRCVCGTKKTINGWALKSGATLSCGCRGRRNRIAAQTTHGMSRTSTYTSWEQMIRRCYNEKFPDFGNYGGRGIRVCDLWRWSFIEFFRDMGTAPKGYSIDRIDNDGNYYPMNCRWADRKTQCRNTRRNKKICFNGEERNLIDWAEIFGLEWYVLWGRLKLGWPVERALMEPVKKWKNRRKINA